MADLPSYDDLPVTPGAPPGSAWGLWGEDDRLGCLNLLTAERATRGASCVRTGRVFPLDLDVTLPDPPLFGRAAPIHTVIVRSEHSRDDELHINTQASTQWDGFRHVANPEHGFYGGRGDEVQGIDAWAERGIVGRGVLADVGRWREAQGRPLDLSTSDVFTAEELLATLDDQGTPFEPGDVLLIRTGWVGWYRSLDRAAREALVGSLASPGLAPGTASARALWDLHVAAVAADNPAFEVWPPDRSRGPEAFLHWQILALLGIPIGELFDLDALAADCAADGTWDFMLTSAPLHVRNGVATPPNALAIR